MSCYHTTCAERGATLILDRMNLFSEEENPQRAQYLTMIVGGEEFGVDIGLVTEIIGMQPISMFPEAPDYVIGVINHRDRVIPLVDMRLRLNKPQAHFTERTCILVIQTKRFGAGLIVDQVANVLEMDFGDIPPQLGAQFSDSRPYISGIWKDGAKEIPLIDCEKLFENNGPECPKPAE